MIGFNNIVQVLSGRYFRHMFREGCVIVPTGGWYEWTVGKGKKQPWYITRKTDDPIFMAGLTYEKPFTRQEVEVGFVIVTQDSQGGTVDVHDRRPVVSELTDALRWMDAETLVEDPAHIAHCGSLTTEAFTWWKVDRAVNSPRRDRRAVIHACLHKHGALFDEITPSISCFDLVRGTMRQCVFANFSWERVSYRLCAPVAEGLGLLGWRLRRRE